MKEYPRDARNGLSIDAIKHYRNLQYHRSAILGGVRLIAFSNFDHLTRAGREVYKGTWHYGKARWVVTEAGERVYPQPEDRWIQVPFPPLVEEETWDRAQAIKNQRRQKSNRNTKIFYLLQHLVRCAECGMLFACRSSTHTYFRRKGTVRKQARGTPQRHYHCYGMLREHMGCRKPAMIRAEQLEELVWSQVKGMVQNPELIVAGIESLDAQEDGGLAEQAVRAERDLHKIQVEEERAIRLYVSGKITENQLDQQRRFITERLEAARATLNDLRARESMASDKRTLIQNLVQWAGKFGRGHILSKLFPGRRQNSNFTRFTSLLDTSVFDEEGIRYTLPDHVYAEESTKW